MDSHFVNVTCRKSGDRYQAVYIRNLGGRERWDCYCNESYQVTRDSRADALDWIQAEADLTVTCLELA